MWECLQSSNDFYNNPSDFSTVDTFLSKSIEESTENQVNWILWLFIWKEKQLSEFIESKMSCSNDDDKMQLWMLQLALSDRNNIQNNSINSLNELQNNLSESNENLDNISIWIFDATARIKVWNSTNEYKQYDNRDPIITKISENTYEIKIRMYRDSSSSWRADENIRLSFKYDWFSLIFYNDKNWDWDIDKRDWTKRIQLYNKGKKWKRHSNHWRLIPIELNASAITQNWVKQINFKLALKR